MAQQLQHKCLHTTLIWQNKNDTAQCVKFFIRQTEFLTEHKLVTDTSTMYGNIKF